MKIIFSFLLSFLILSCAAQRICATYDSSQKQPEQAFHEYSLQNSIGSFRDTLPGEVITVPVIIHILYNNKVQNISDEQVLSQLDVLNKDYRRLNDIQNIPAAFASYSADAKIIFCLAKTDPSGQPTTGIIRKYSDIANWPADDKMKFSASQGDNAWDSRKYLNIWVCNFSGKNLGYSSLPGSPADKDGIVIQYDVFGTTGTVRSPFDKGRTATHEIGHWLGLMHTWGDAMCGDDHIDDTPPQRSYNNGCPSFPHTSTCSINGNGDMFMDFMDFTDDGCMSMFTHGQVNEMRSMFAVGHARNSFLNSTVCESPEQGKVPLPADTVKIAAKIILIYPNPAKDVINFEAKNGADLIGQTFKIYTVSGTEVKSGLLYSAKNTISVSSFPFGIYIVKIGEGKDVKVMRLLKQ